MFNGNRHELINHLIQVDLHADNAFRSAKPVIQSSDGSVRVTKFSVVEVHSWTVRIRITWKALCTECSGISVMERFT